MRNVVIITARMQSERLPGKALVDIAGCPNLARIVDRFRRCRRVHEIVVATTEDGTDEAIAAWCHANGVAEFRGPRDDVIARVHAAAQAHKADYVLRATTDCPFISAEMVDAAFAVVAQHRADTGRIWGMPDRGVPVYGAAEFPYSLAALRRMNEESQAAEREHVGMRLDAHRLQYKVVYPVPPCDFSKAFYRPYRLELDTPADLELVRHVVRELGPLPPLQQVVRYLDAHPDVAQFNAHVAEKTGPLTSFTPEHRAQWKHQQAMNSVEWQPAPGAAPRWDWAWLTSGSPAQLPKGTQPLFCGKGRCYVGYVARGPDKVHRLHTPDGTVLTGRATLACSCGAGREWYDDASKQ